MRILSINPKINNNLNFKAIKLSEEETASANKLLEAYTNADSEKDLNEANEKLFLLFDKHIQPEAELKAKNAYNPFDVLQNMYLVYLQVLSEFRVGGGGQNLLSKIIEALNNYKPSKQDLKDGYDKSTVSIQSSIDSPKIKNDSDDITIEDSLTREDLPVPLSQQNEEEIQNSKNIINGLTNDVLDEKNKDIVEKRTMGLEFREIAEEHNLSYTIIRRKFLSSIAKLQKKNGTLPKLYEIKARELQERFSLEQNIDEIIDMLIKNIYLLPKDTAIIEDKIKISSELLEIPKQKFINAAFRQPVLFYCSPETTNKKVNDSSKLLEISREEFINAALIQPQLFFQKAETLNQNVSNSAELLEISKEEFINAALKQPSLFCQKLKTLNQKINKLAELFNIDRTEVIQKIIANPAILTNDPQSLKLTTDINRYYAKLQGKKIHQSTFLYSSPSKEYSKILIFLMNKKANMKLLTISNTPYKDLKDFLAEFHNFTMTFEVPYDEVLEGLIQFAQKLTKEITERENLFKFQITDDYNFRKNDY